MSKEFHVYTHQDKDFEQALVFEVDRSQDEVIFKDLLMVTTTKHGELRTRVQLDNIIQNIIITEGGNIENSSVETIIDLFKGIIPDDKRTEILDEINQQEIEDISAEDLINASEYAKIMELAETIERVENEKDRGTT